VEAQHQPAASSAERVALNDAAFREANERIRAVAGDWEMEGMLPVLCECADTTCTTVVRMRAREYEAVREDPRHFINAPGHNASGGGWAQVIAEREGYEIVTKVGEAGEIVEELDPRARNES
jgi:hypothetical protein